MNLIFRNNNSKITKEREIFDSLPIQVQKKKQKFMEGRRGLNSGD